MKNSIALVGFMGAGKSTVGKALAERLHWAFVDTDSLIEERLGLTTSQVFGVHGEQYFREAEARAIERATQMNDVVIAVGGGAVENRRVRSALQDRCMVVLLSVDIATILERTEGITGRPLLDGIDPDQKRARIMELLHSRASTYNEVYDVVVDASADVESTVKAIEAHINGAREARTALTGG
ncbi:MAG: shikimate kinase [Bacillota bacterium]|nr:shikimate kinase [Bacillota bacterium]